ncbi:MAG: 50S ribosomal protein L22 [Candidatus Micrarchaeota archaeon]
MVEFGYSYKPATGTKSAKAQGHDIEASYKDLTQVCAAIRGKMAGEAVKLLEDAAAMKIPILYHKFNKRLGHRHELGGRKGRYPRKCARLVLEVLRNALGNAGFRGMGEANLVVRHACANKQSIIGRLAPKGRRARMDYETARVEIVLEEIPTKTETKTEKKNEKK